jgi:predicted negative regulator of RcsB-dependent stress response
MATSSPVSGGPSEWEPDAIKDWIVGHARPLVIGAGVVVGIVLVVYFWRQSVELKAQRAEAAFATAQSAFYSGNAALAKSDLEKAVTRYKGTPGGTEAAMLLAQILYGESKYDDGIQHLTTALAGAPEFLAPAVEEMIAAGYADSKRYPEAVRHLTSAADRARFKADKHIYQAEAARILTAAGQPQEARKIWLALASETESPVMTEAKVRLGELDAKAVQR